MNTLNNFWCSSKFINHPFGGVTMSEVNLELSDETKLIQNKICLVIRQNEMKVGCLLMSFQPVISRVHLHQNGHG